MFPWWKSNNSSQVHTTLLRYRSPVPWLWCALRSSCCPPPRSGSTRLNIGRFQYFKSSLKTMTVEVVQTDVHLKQGNKLDCLILEEARWNFFTLRVMIILSLFTHHKVKGSFNNLCQNKAFLGCWGWIGSTKMLCKSAGEAVRLRWGVLTPLTSCPSQEFSSLFYRVRP